jgi:hypothetical protein
MHQWVGIVRQVDGVLRCLLLLLLLVRGAAVELARALAPGVGVAAAAAVQGGRGSRQAPLCIPLLRLQH